MTTASDVAVVATHLAQTDRRALSQAWYSALHVAPGDARAAIRSTRAPNASSARVGERAVSALAESDMPGKMPAEARTSRGAGVSSPFVERRNVADASTRRVERAVAALARAPRRTVPHTVALAGGRVTIVIRGDAHATRIVALCSEPLRATVERALAHARFALASRGASVNAS